MNNWRKLNLTTSDENQMLLIRDEINEVCTIYEEEEAETVNCAVEAAGNDKAELTAEPPKPKRRSFLSVGSRETATKSR